MITSTVLMVEPTDFTYNYETEKDNSFQNNIMVSDLSLRVLKEFNNFVDILKSNNINVITYKKTESIKDVLCDAVFPNNWITTFYTEYNSRLIFVHKMFALNRQNETKQLNDILLLLKQNNITNNIVYDLTNNQDVLEGTGSMIIDRNNKIIYAGLSKRTNYNAICEYAKLIGYNKIYTFETQDSNNIPFYHTNIIMSIGEDYIVVCMDAIKKCMYELLLNIFKKLYKSVIIISLEQTEKYFCGNILQLKNKFNKKFIIMSERAFNGFTENQLKELSNYGTILSIPLWNIEHVGGGSARCMLAEIFI